MAPKKKPAKTSSKPSTPTYVAGTAAAGETAIPVTVVYGAGATADAKATAGAAPAAPPPPALSRATSHDSEQEQDEGEDESPTVSAIPTSKAHVAPADGKATAAAAPAAGGQFPPALRAATEEHVSITVTAEKAEDSGEDEDESEEDEEPDNVVRGNTAVFDSAPGAPPPATLSPEQQAHIAAYLSSAAEFSAQMKTHSAQFTQFATRISQYYADMDAKIPHVLSAKSLSPEISQSVVQLWNAFQATIVPGISQATQFIKATHEQKASEACLHRMKALSDFVAKLPNAVTQLKAREQTEAVFRMLRQANEDLLAMVQVYSAASMHYQRCDHNLKIIIMHFSNLQRTALQDADAKIKLLTPRMQFANERITALATVKTSDKKYEDEQKAISQKGKQIGEVTAEFQNKIRRVEALKESLKALTMPAEEKAAEAKQAPTDGEIVAKYNALTLKTNQIATEVKACMQELASAYQACLADAKIVKQFAYEAQSIFNAFTAEHATFFEVKRTADETESALSEATIAVDRLSCIAAPDLKPQAAPLTESFAKAMLEAKTFRARWSTVAKLKSPDQKATDAMTAALKECTDAKAALDNAIAKLMQETVGAFLEQCKNPSSIHTLLHTYCLAVAAGENRAALNAALVNALTLVIPIDFYEALPGFLELLHGIDSTIIDRLNAKFQPPNQVTSQFTEHTLLKLLPAMCAQIARKPGKKEWLLGEVNTWLTENWANSISRLDFKNVKDTLADGTLKDEIDKLYAAHRREKGGTFFDKPVSIPTPLRLDYGRFFRFAGATGVAAVAPVATAGAGAAAAADAKSSGGGAAPKGLFPPPSTIDEMKAAENIERLCEILKSHASEIDNANIKSAFIEKAKAFHAQTTQTALSYIYGELIPKFSGHSLYQTMMGMAGDLRNAFSPPQSVATPSQSSQ